MKQNSRTGSRLFFIEFLIVLFFFFIISTVCLRLFARAHTVTQHSEALSHAQTTAASVAAVLESGHVQPEDAAAFFDGASVSGDGFFITYDGEFQPCAADRARYALNVSIKTDGQELSAAITVENSDHSLLYELPVSLHLPLAREEALQ